MCAVQMMRFKLFMFFDVSD